MKSGLDAKPLFLQVDVLIVTLLIQSDGWVPTLSNLSLHKTGFTHNKFYVVKSVGMLKVA